MTSFGDAQHQETTDSQETGGGGGSLSASLTYLTAVSNVYSCSGPPTDSNFLSTLLANREWHFKQANHGAHANPGTQVRAWNKDFGAVSQTDLPRV